MRISTMQFDPKKRGEKGIYLSRIKGWLSVGKSEYDGGTEITEELFSIAHGARARRCN